MGRWRADVVKLADLAAVLDPGRVSPAERITDGLHRSRVKLRAASRVLPPRVDTSRGCRMERRADTSSCADTSSSDHDKTEPPLVRVVGLDAERQIEITVLVGLRPREPSAELRGDEAVEAEMPPAKRQRQGAEPAPPADVSKSVEEDPRPGD
jgi:hypothetical protein